MGGIGISRTRAVAVRACLAAAGILFAAQDAAAQQTPHIAAAGVETDIAYVELSDVDAALRLDSLVLVRLFHATGGPQWKRSRGWLKGSLRSGEWEHVVVQNGRVVGLDLAANNLTGELPDALGQLTALRTLSLDGNEISGALPVSIRSLESLSSLFLSENDLVSLPDLTGLEHLIIVDVSANRLSFEDVERNADLGDRLLYAAQKKFGHAQTVIVGEGEPLELVVDIHTVADRTEWLRDGVVVDSGGSRSPRLMIAAASMDDAGSYSVRAYRSDLPELVLESRPVDVQITPRPEDPIGMTAMVPDESKPLRFFGDLRVRGELDRNFRASDGVRHSNRDRARFRLRGGFVYRRSRHVAFGGRVRTSLNDESAYATFGDELAPKGVFIDKAYIQTMWTGGTLWIGKNDFPLWRRNQLLWDDDITPEGLAVSQHRRLRKDLTLSGYFGYFILQPSANTSLIDLTRLATFQIVASHRRGTLSLRSGLAYLDFSHNFDIEDRRLGDLDYRITSLSVSATTTSWRFPITIGGDLYLNLEGYRPKMFNRSEKTGWSLSGGVGSLKETGDWTIRYTYAYIEKYAVVAGYAQDDWVRWETDGLQQASNFKGHEIRADYAIGVNSVVSARFYSVDGIAPESRNAVSRQEGTRFRIDWTVGF